MNTLKVSHKLALGFAAILALTMAVALIGIYGMDALISRSDQAQSAALLLDEANHINRSVRDVADQSAAAAQQTAASTVQLARLGSELQELTARLRV
ncbi:hypothetical protein GFL09_21700 [Pseudomonas stutzeri]|uniref:hypothetical protein n=1 Tax=Stutzerimonas stutzeri TaxID=316 RepID=UPI00190CFAB1|nr:hypothetical protein [Stutzerimonas stutzeri]MBK3870261.1 hypothetical protein [Stutzerimonas stutzeri]